MGEKLFLPTLIGASSELIDKQQSPPSSQSNKITHEKIIIYHTGKYYAF